tara:strand:- start:983 stop:1912 length:930 start_codon:yes stop_codon:yes gene_type:complete
MNDNQETQQSANPMFDESVFTDSPQVGEGSNQEETLSPTDAFAEPSGAEAPTEAPSTQEMAKPTDPKNDETRYQYWQSQAAKRENEMKALQAQLQQQQQFQPQMAQPQVPEQPVKEEFPAPPERPVKPRNFNRQEAFEDASSESARYLDEVDDWRDNMEEYRTLKDEYETSLVQEQINQQKEQQMQAERARQAQMQQAAQVKEVEQLVQGHYGMSKEDTQEFIKTMSDPASITVDNLVQLYRLQKGQGGGAPVNPGQPAQPSPQFQQAQRAQQVPQPMGVQPTAGNIEAPAEDQIMDNIITDYKKNNPW